MDQSFVENILAQSSDAVELKNIISNHFNELNEDCMLSIGLEEKQKVSDVVNALRKKGINAVGYYNNGAEALDTFVVDGSGIRSPFLSPQDALQASADIYEILKAEGIKFKGHVLPQTKENFVFCGHQTSKNDTKEINVAENYSQLNDENNQTAIEYLIETQLKTVKDMPLVSVEEMEQNNANRQFLYRGGTLGAQPYAVISSRRGRDVCYSSPSFEVASDYATGVYSVGVSYKPVDGKKYGFIYEYETAKDQKYYGMYGIERGKSNPLLNKENGVEGGDKYETPVMPHRNKLRNIYLQYGDDDDKRIVKIAENGKYVSENWENFAKAHEVVSTVEPNDMLIKRLNLLKKKLLNNESATVKYSKEKKLQPLDESIKFENLVQKQNVFELNGEQYIRNLSLQLMNLDSSIEKKSLSGDILLNSVNLDNVKKLDLSKCKGNITLKDCDLSSVEEIVFPQQCNYIYFSGNKISSKLKSLDFSNTKMNSFVLENQDASSIDSFKFPSQTSTQYHLFGLNRMSKKVDLGGLPKSVFSANFDFSSTKEILPKKHPISLKNKIAVLRNQMAATLASKKTKRHNINKLNINLSDIKNYER